MTDDAQGLQRRMLAAAAEGHREAEAVRQRTHARLCSAVHAASMAGMSQSEAAEVIGCSQPTVGRLIAHAEMAENAARQQQ